MKKLVLALLTTTAMVAGFAHAETTAERNPAAKKKVKKKVVTTTTTTTTEEISEPTETQSHEPKETHQEPLPQISHHEYKSSDNSEHFYQPAAGVSYFTPSFFYNSANTSYKTTSADLNVRGTDFGIEYGYGFSDVLAANITLQYASFHTSGGLDSKIKGLEDVEFNLKGSLPAGPGHFKFGTELTISPGKYEAKQDNSSNAYSGGHAVNPYVGYETKISSFLVGAELSHEFNLTDKKVKGFLNGVETEQKQYGGETTAEKLFLEKPYNSGKAGLILLLSQTADTKVKDVNAKTEHPDIFGAAIYGAHNFTTSSALLWQIDYTKTTSGTNIVSSRQSWTYALGGRFEF